MTFLLARGAVKGGGSDGVERVGSGVFGPRRIFDDG